MRRVYLEGTGNGLEVEEGPVKVTHFT